MNNENNGNHFASTDKKVIWSVCFEVNVCIKATTWSGIRNKFIFE